MKATYKGRVVMIGDSNETGICELVNLLPVAQRKSEAAFFNAGYNDAMKLAHRRTCHNAADTVKQMQSTNAVDGLDIVTSTKDTRNICEACVDGKAMNKAPYRRNKSTKEVLERMHTDLCGKKNPPGLNGELYT